MKKAAIILLIIIIILVIIRAIIMLIAMSVYNSAASTINDSLTHMSTQEIEAFNNQFESYRNEQTGSQISSLCGRLIANAKTFEGEPNKIPEVEFISTDESGDISTKAEYYKEGDESQYEKALAKVKNIVNMKKKYNVSFAYSTEGFLDRITIEDAVANEENSKVSNTTNTQTNEIINSSVESFVGNEVESQTTNTVSSTTTEETQEYNNAFVDYEGEQTGATVYEMMTTLKANCNKYEYEPSKVPEIDYGTSYGIDVYEITAVYDKIEDKSSYLEKIVEIKNLLEDDHTYTVSFKYVDLFVDKVIISY